MVETPSKPVFITPTAHGWNLLRARGSNGEWDVRMLRSLEEIVPLVSALDDIVLSLPISAVLAQRFKLPTIDPAEFPEMVRIQIEKALPFSLDEVTADFELIEQNEAESVISAVAVRNEQLAEIAAPLIDNGVIPKQVTVYAAQRATTHAPEGRALLIYPEGETLVSAVTENGKVSMTRALDGVEPDQLKMELPQLALSAELQGIDASFPNVLLDETCYELRDTVSGILESKTELVGIETPPASVKLNLLPDSWRQRRTQLAKRSEWRKRLTLAGSIYAGIFLLFVLYLAYTKIAIVRLNQLIARDAPQTQFIRETEANWKSLAPAIDARFYPVEILYHLSQDLPSADVHITAYNQSARQISVDGEANTAALAYQFAEKVKKDGALQNFRFDMAAPRLLPNSHAQFRLEGKPR
jgi:type IV pilus assembly PilM-like protein